MPTATASTADNPARLGPWFHNLHLPDGRQTAPDHFLGDFPRFKWDEFRDHLPADLDGWSVLDIGCNGGFYTIELARRGARVTAIDHDPRYLDQARWAVDQFDLAHRVTLLQREVYDLARPDALPQATYDLVLFLGVLYHLRYPLLGLDLVADRVGRMLVLQTLSMPGGEGTIDVPEDVQINDRDRMLDDDYPKMAFIEHRLQGDPTNWWAPNPACIQAMLRSANLAVTRRVGDETYLCRPAPGDRAMNRAAPAGAANADPRGSIRTPDPA